MDLGNQPLSQLGNKYEVFLSYSRGQDTQESFPSHLYSSLRKAGISVLQDDISIELLRSIIEGSEISIVIFSDYYASSGRCLDELTKIMEFRRSYDQVVLPIFYGVDQSEVRNQESSFGEAFRGLIQRISPTEDQVSRWRTALNKAGSFNGFFVPHFESNNESEDIQNIVKRVRDILGMKGSFDTHGLVGVSCQVQQVIKMLQKYSSKDVVAIGIWGLGGIGKTTLARCIFEHIRYEFESTCFLSDLRDAWRREGEDLQKRLLSEICEATDMRIDSIERPCHKKVLLVLDDVSDSEQLDALCGHREWFGKGSRIIITSRNRHVLMLFEPYIVYDMKTLGVNDSLELLRRTAFEQASPEGEYIDLSKRMVAYAVGVPLLLKVLGSSLRGRSLMEWESVLIKLETFAFGNPIAILKLCYDPLQDEEKELFLNIVLFYIGEDMNDVIQEMDGRGCDAISGMRVLVDRSLVTIDENNKLRMHDLLLGMGIEIIRQNSQNELQNRGHRYEVFLSFRGEDTRATFTSHLYSALYNAGIAVFKDDVELPRGEYIKTGLLQAIGSSKIAIIIFSRKYAASKWCLEELSMIMEHHKSNDLVVLPVFYDVDPSEIRNQTSSFGEAFEGPTKTSLRNVQVSKWKRALREAGGIAGIVVLGSRDESENVKAIVENVCDMLDKKDLFVAEHPIGVDNRVQEVITLLQSHQSEDVVMLGICGMGGVGKTTIAKAIYNEIGRTFDGRSYLPKIRKVWHQKKGKVRLQRQLLSEICKAPKTEINCIDSGKNILSGRLCHKKALVVLDDVDKSAQLKALAGSRDWFKPGSIIIITTRNQDLLREMGCRVYIMKELDQSQSLALLSWHAFKQESPKENFSECSRDIVEYSGGIPLALEVLGSYLFGREAEEWEWVLETLKKIPHNKIHKKLKISFDGLSDMYNEKEIFLDIACFFIGMDRNDVTQILNACGFVADSGIKTLVEQSLVTIDENKLVMHDLLRDMGREIIREQSEKELGKRSRLWFHKDARAVLSKHMGTKAIEGISLKLSRNRKKHFQAEAFKKMKRLRLLHLDNVQLKGDYKYISRDLKWLCWHHFPAKYFPSNIYQKKLVAIDLKYSSLKQVWKEPRLLKKLKILNLSHSLYLVQTPDFSKLPNLEKLILKDCPKLSKIHHSIGLLHNLFLLDLEDCTGLRSLPRSIYRLKCLKTLILSGCKYIKKLKEDIEQMESLTTLIAPTIKQAPFSLGRLKRILYLSICGLEGLSHHVIPSLHESWMSPTKNPLLRTLTHAGMPSAILWTMLNSIPGSSTIPSSELKQQSLLLEDGSKIPDFSCATNCMDISRLKNRLGHLLIHIGKNSQVFDTLSERISQGLSLPEYSDDCVLPGDNYPYWRTFKGEGAYVGFKVPPINDRDHLKGMTICCAYFPSGDSGNKACESCIICLLIINYTKATNWVYTRDKLKSLEEAERKIIISNIESDDQVEVKAVFENGVIVKKIAVYLIYNESFDDQMKSFPSEATS